MQNPPPRRTHNAEEALDRRAAASGPTARAAANAPPSLAGPQLATVWMDDVAALLRRRTALETAAEMARRNFNDRGAPRPLPPEPPTIPDRDPSGKVPSPRRATSPPQPTRSSQTARAGAEQEPPRAPPGARPLPAHLCSLGLFSPSAAPEQFRAHGALAARRGDVLDSRARHGAIHAQARRPSTAPHRDQSHSSALAARQLSSDVLPQRPLSLPGVPTKPVHGKYEGVHGQHFTFGTNGAPVELDPGAVKRNEVRLSGTLLPRTKSGRNPATSDITVAYSQESLRAAGLLYILPLLIESGFLGDASQRSTSREAHASDITEATPSRRSRPNAYGDRGVATRSVALTCSAAHFATVALCDTKAPPEWLREPVDLSVYPTPPHVSSHEERAKATSKVFVQCGLSLFALMQWFDFSDPEYLASSRPHERLVSHYSTTFSEAITRQDVYGAPGFANLTVTSDMKRARESYNDKLTEPWARRNHRSVIAAKDKIGAELSKEVHLRWAIVLLPLCRFFMPTFLKVPIGVVTKGEKTRIIMDAKDTGGVQGVDAEGTTRPASLNQAVPKDDITTCVYGSALLCMLWVIYRIRCGHPKARIYCILVDVSSAFKHIRQNHRMWPASAAWIFGMIFLFVTLCFGSSYSPGEFSIAEESVLEIFNSLSIATISVIPAAFVFSAAFERPELPPESDDINLARGREDDFNVAIRLTTDSKFLARSFVDDGWICQIRHCDNALHKTLTAYLWAHLGFFSYLSLPARHSFVNLLKLEANWWSSGKALGYMINTDTLTLSAPSNKVNSLLKILTEWAADRIRMAPAMLESILGSIRYVGVMMPLATFLTSRLAKLLGDAMKGFKFNHNLILETTSSHSDKHRYIEYALPKGARADVENIIYYLAQDSDKNIFYNAPFERLLWRSPLMNAPSDASGWGCGGWIRELRIGWQLQWNPDVSAWFASHRNVNVLEYAGVVINCIVAAAACESADIMVPVLQWCDNTSAVSWGNTARMPTPSAAALAHIHGYWLSTSNVHSRTAYVEGPRNDIGDYFSRHDVAEDFGSAPTNWPHTRTDAHTSSPISPLTHPWLSQVDTLISIPEELSSMICTAVCSGISPQPIQMAQIKAKLTSEFSRIGLPQFTVPR